MNGMTRKKLQRARAGKYTPEGLPREANDWTEEDWRDLHECLERVRQRVAQRHRKERES